MLTTRSQDEASGRYLRGALFGLSAIAIWAGWMAVTRIGVTSSLDAHDITALRYTVAGLILLPVVWRRGWALDRLGWPRLIVLISGAGAPYALITAQGLNCAPAADAGALTPGVMPLFVALMAVLLLKETLAPGRRVGLGLILTGVLCLAGVSLLSGDLTRSSGHGLFLVGALFWAGFTVTMRWAGLAPLHATALVSVGSMLGYAPVYLALNGTRLLELPLADVALQAFYQGVLSTVVAIFLFGRAIALLGASGGAAFGALVPALAALLAIPLLGEFPAPADWLGIGAITIGVYLASGGPLPGPLGAVGRYFSG